MRHILWWSLPVVMCTAGAEDDMGPWAMATLRTKQHRARYAVLPRLIALLSGGSAVDLTPTAAHANVACVLFKLVLV